MSAFIISRRRCKGISSSGISLFSYLRSIRICHMNRSFPNAERGINIYTSVGQFTPLCSQSSQTWLTDWEGHILLNHTFPKQIFPYLAFACPTSELFNFCHIWGPVFPEGKLRPLSGLKKRAIFDSYGITIKLLLLSKIEGCWRKFANIYSIVKELTTFLAWNLF